MPQPTFFLWAAHLGGITRPEPRHSHRLRIALVVIGITVGILALFALQFLIPYFFGPAGLLIVVGLDLGTYLGVRHRKVRRMDSRNVGRSGRAPADGRSVPHAHGPVQDATLATLALFAFLVGCYLVGTSLRFESAWVSTNLALYFLGTVLTAITLGGLTYMVYPYPTALRMRSESEVYDTTEDH